MIMNGDEKIAGVLSDYDPLRKMFKVTDVVTKEKNLKDKEVVLSGYSNATYKGIHVGVVFDEQDNNYGLSKTLWVKSSVSFEDLLFVAVVRAK